MESAETLTNRWRDNLDDTAVLSGHGAGRQVGSRQMMELEMTAQREISETGVCGGVSTIFSYVI